MRSIVFLLFFFANQLRVFWKKFYLPISTHAAFNDPSLCTNPGIKNIRIAMITNNSLAVSLLLIKENNQRGFGWFHKLRHCLRFTLLCAFKWCAVCVWHMIVCMTPAEGNNWEMWATDKQNNQVRGCTCEEIHSTQNWHKPTSMRTQKLYFEAISIRCYDSRVLSMLSIILHPLLSMFSTLLKLNIFLPLTTANYLDRWRVKKKKIRLDSELADVLNTHWNLSVKCVKIIFVTVWRIAFLNEVVVLTWSVSGNKARLCH